MKGSIAVAAGCIALAAPCAAAQSIFLGENALALATLERDAATPQRAAELLRGILERLEVPAERRAQYSYVSSARLVRSEAYFETDELSEAVLVAGKSVRIGFAHNVLVIANGDVDIAHGAGLVVIAGGSIRLGHESAHLGPAKPSGIYISKGSVELSAGVRPIVYAVRGAKTGYSGPVTAYNTDVSVPAGVRVERANRTALFLGEPLRPLSEPSMRFNAGESIAFEGARCAQRPDAADEALFDRLLPYVRREADCPRIEAARVDCVRKSGSDASFRSEERWTFTLCGKTAEVQVVREPTARSMNLVRLRDASGAEAPRRSGSAYGSAPAPRFAPPKLSVADAKQVSALFKAALGHTVRGELVEARGKYLEVLGIAEHAGARHNLAGLDSQIERADRATAVYTSRIAAGHASARTFAERGLAYITVNDVSRGLRDLDRAVAMASTDSEVLIARARGYLLGNRPAQAEHFMTELVNRESRFAQAYELRAWANLLQDRPERAYRDAFSSLVEGPAWTPASFGEQKAGYRALAGYFALRQTDPRAKAMAWLRGWQPMLEPGRWPDALLLFFLGEIDEREMLEPAQSLVAADRGAAAAEAVTFLALDEFLGGSTGAREREALAHYRTSYGAGRTLAWLVDKRMRTPGEKLTLQRQ